MKRPFLAIVAFVFYLSAFSQVNICGTYISSQQSAFENAFTFTSISTTESLPQLNRDLSIVIYIVKDTSYNAGVTLTDIDAALYKLNGYFAPISLKFHRCNIVYVNNYQFDKMVQDKNEKDLTSINSTPNMINLFLVSEIEDRYMNKVKGFSYMPGDVKNFIFLTKKNLNSSEIGHQFGHFFNLYHTHETFFGDELVDRINCTTMGDKCCDTDADPNLSGKVNGSCVYTANLKDVNGKFYKPSVKNIMSFSNDNCRCFFSNDQFLRVIKTIEQYKSDLR
jgi:hypothetical protein